MLIGVGIWAYFATQEYKVDADGIFDIFFDVSLLFIVFGGVVFILAFLGAVGALRENTTLLKAVSYHHQKLLKQLLHLCFFSDTQY